jgi:hypothetical protein
MSTLPAIFFFGHPFPNVERAVLKRHAVCFATHEEPHHLPIDHAHVSEIDDDVAAVCVALEKPFQLGHRLRFDVATQDENAESPSRHSLDPERHGLDA